MPIPVLQTCRRGATALAIAAGAASIAASAWAQIVLPGNTVVELTAPTSGSPLRGTVTLAARVSGNGLIGISTVQFRVDGVDVGGGDSVAPYTMSWDTRSATDGWHTLQAVARDALGLQYTSSPVTVTVANAAAPVRPTVRVEQTDPAVAYGAGWGPRDPDWFDWSGGSAAQASIPGARATFHFSGTSVSWIGYRSGVSGIARVSVDGVRYPDVDLFAKTDEIGVPVFSASGLTDGPHTLSIEATGQMNPESIAPLVVIDAFEPPARTVSRLQETDPALAYSAGWTLADRSKAWSSNTAAFTAAAGARATLSFNGGAIGWRGYRGPDAGIARVYVDGAFVRELDLYAANQVVQSLVFSADGPEGDHTLTVESTGRRNAAASDALIVIDALDVAHRGRRVEETDWSIAYTSDWEHLNRNRTWSGATASKSNTAGGRATISFTGTSVRWIGLRGVNCGIARVYLDGAFVGEIDTYAATEGPQDTVFNVAGLADMAHTLTIEATGRKNAAANLAWVIVDAFDVAP